MAGERDPSSERAVHLAIYAARPDVLAIVHTHSPAALSTPPEGLPIADRADPGTLELADRTARALDQGDAVLMAGHGVVAVGASPAEALAAARRVEAASV